MSTKQITAAALALPLPKRVELAQALWQSIEVNLPVADESAAVKEAVRRDQECSSNAVPGRSHAEVMRTARRAIQCH